MGGDLEAPEPQILLNVQPQTFMERIDGAGNGAAKQLASLREELAY